MDGGPDRHEPAAAGAAAPVVGPDPLPDSTPPNAGPARKPLPNPALLMPITLGVAAWFAWMTIRAVEGFYMAVFLGERMLGKKNNWKVVRIENDSMYWATAMGSGLMTFVYAGLMCFFIFLTYILFSSSRQAAAPTRP